MKSKTVPLICYTCRKEFGKAIFSAACDVGHIAKFNQITRYSYDDPFDIKFFCSENCSRQQEHEGAVIV